MIFRYSDNYIHLQDILNEFQTTLLYVNNDLHDDRMNTKPANQRYLARLHLKYIHSDIPGNAHNEQVKRGF